MADALLEQVERWRNSRYARQPGHVSSPERLASGLVGVGLLMLSRSDRRCSVPAGVAAGAALTRAAPVCARCTRRSIARHVDDGILVRLSRPAHSQSDRHCRAAGRHGFHILAAAHVDRWATRGKITVDNIDGTRSRWQLRTSPDGEPLVEWTAELINEVPDKVLGWQTTSDADVVSAGSVNFVPAPGTQGTEVRVHLQYAPPLGRVGSAAATLSGNPPSMVVREALRDIKRFLEFGRSVVLTA